MRRIIDSVDSLGVTRVLTPEDRKAVRAGFEIVDQALILTRYKRLLRMAPPDFDRWERERWSNKIHLDSDRDPSDPLWRPELVARGLALGQALLDRIDGLSVATVHAVISLQSAPGEADPDLDLATGALHLYQVRGPDEDLSALSYAQPVLVMSRTPAGR
jgi:hypothetical protein